MNKDVPLSEISFGIASIIAVCIDRLQKITKCSMTVLEVRKNDYPKAILLKWIHLGIELVFVFTDEGMNYKLYEPEDLASCTVEYQERIADCRDVLSKLGFKQIKEKRSQ